MKNTTKSNIGIMSIACNLPKKIMTAGEVSSLSGFSENDIIDKLGFRKKRIANFDEHPSKFALNAAKKALRNSNFAARDLDFIIYCSNGVYDYQFWSPSAYLQNKIKACKAITFEINNGCNAAIAGMFLAKNLLSNKSFNYGLVVVSDTLSKLVDYTNKNSFPLFSFADGASAILMGKNHHTNILLSQTLHTDGSFSECNKLFSGGTRNYEGTASNDKFISVDYHGKKTIELRNSAMSNNYIKVINEAIRSAGIKVSDISRFFINQNSISIVGRVIKELDIPATKLYSIRKYYGHIGAIDTLFALEQCLNKKLIMKNDIVILASTGIGYHWGAQVIKI